MALHDIKCVACGKVGYDVNIHHSQIQDGVAYYECQCGSTLAELRYDLWEEKDLNLFNDGLGGFDSYQRTDKKGFIREFGVSDDSLAQIQLGMFKKPTDKSLKNFTEDQTMQYRERLLAEGDSGKLRKEIIETYKSNKEKGL